MYLLTYMYRNVTRLHAIRIRSIQVLVQNTRTFESETHIRNRQLSPNTLKSELRFLLNPQD